MPNFAYRYFYNSDGLVSIDGQFVGRKLDATHLPSLDGFRTGDELTLAFEGSISVNAHGEEFGVQRMVCAKLFQQFNAPWERPNEYAGPTMSIGDVIELYPGTDKHMAFSVEKQGFKLCTISLSTQKLIPTKWLRTSEELVEYLRAKRDDGQWLTEAEEEVLYHV